MTPKKKAKQLVKKFMSIDSYLEKFYGFKMAFFYAQRCALIAVDEILNEYWAHDTDRHDYWKEVKKEIEKL